MDEAAKSLLKQLKASPNLPGYLQLANVYKRNGKFFSAQTTLQEAMDTIKPPAEALDASPLAQLLGSMTDLLGDDFPRIEKPPNSTWFLPSALLSELHLLQGHCGEALSCAVFAAQCYTDSALHRKVYWTVLACVLIEAWLKWAYIFIYKKKFEKALQCYAYLEQLTEFFSAQQPIDCERYSSVLATVQLSRHIVLKDQSALSKAGAYLAAVESGETLLCYLHLIRDPRAGAVARSLVQSHSDNLTYWVWLGIVEHNAAAVRKALSLEAKSWLAWCALAWLQYEAGAMQDCAYSLRVAHKLNYQDYRLPLLRSVLLRDLGQVQAAGELLSFACDLEPSLGLYQLI